MKIGSEPPKCPHCGAELLAVEEDTKGIKNKQSFQFKQFEIDGRLWGIVNCSKCCKLISIFESKK